MPQGSSAWVWMSIATTFSISGSLSLGISGFPAGLIFGSGKLIILYNKFRKAAEAKEQEQGVQDVPGRRLRDRFLERRQSAKGLGRHRSRRAAQDHSLHADQGSDRTLLQIGWRGSPDLFRRGLRQDHPLWRADRAALDPYLADVLLHTG